MPKSRVDPALAIGAREPARPSTTIAAVPRWEWRSFDYQPQRWRDALRLAEPIGPGTLNAEIYLLARQSPSNVKLRDERVEVKQLVRTDANGLELWRPILNEGFPLGANVLAELCDLWKHPRPGAVPVVPTPEHLLSFLARQATEVRVMAVRKWRQTYRVDGCIAQRATIVVGGSLLESLALAQVDPGRLLTALRALHLDAEPNTNYVLALKRLMGWPDSIER